LGAADHIGLDQERVRQLPKVELHVHVESCISEEAILQLAADQGVPPIKPPGELFDYSSLREFLDAFEWWCDLLCTPEIAEQVAYDAACSAHADGIAYAEMLTGPRYWTHLAFDQLLPALGAGFDRARADGLADCRVVPSISREQSSEWAMSLVEWIGDSGLVGTQVVGLGLDGNEVDTGRTCPKFEAAYAMARELGLGRTVHAGESSGPEGVRDALDYLHVDRIDHGVRAIEDSGVVERLAREQVTLNVCPSSNVMLGLYPDLEAHPIGRLKDAGVPVTVNSDDPASMRLTLSGEFTDVGTTLGWTIDDVILATETAVAAAFCDTDRKAELRGMLRDATSRARGALH
jgi:adenosine deaminase